MLTNEQATFNNINQNRLWFSEISYHLKENELCEKNLMQNFVNSKTINC